MFITLVFLFFYMRHEEQKIILLHTIKAIAGNIRNYERWSITISKRGILYIVLYKIITALIEGIEWEDIEMQEKCVRSSCNAE